MEGRGLGWKKRGSERWKERRNRNERRMQRKRRGGKDKGKEGVER